MITESRTYKRIEKAIKTLIEQQSNFEIKDKVKVEIEDKTEDRIEVGIKTK